MTPASSPGKRSAVSTEKPWRSAYLPYMRSSILVQSCASVPPAPACSVRIALLASYSPLSSIPNSKCSSSLRHFASSSSISGSRLSSFSSAAISCKASKSSTPALNLWKPSTSSFKLLTSCAVFCAFSGSSQKVGSPILCSNSAIRSSLTAMSKRSPHFL